MGKSCKVEVIGGNCNCLDHIIIPYKFPDINEKIFVKEYHQQGGGVSSNALITLAKLGVKCAFWGFAGKDEFSNFLKNDFLKYNINVDLYYQDEKHITAQSFIIIDPKSGKRTVLAHTKQYEGHLFNIKDFDRFLPDVKVALLDTYNIRYAVEVARWAKENSLEIVLDSGTYKKDMEKIFEYVDYFIAPDDFIKGYFKRELSIEEGIYNLSKEWKFKFTAITAGEKGCYALIGNKVKHFPAYSILKVKDITGAGDVFHGAFTYGILQNWNIEKCLKWANVTAALKCRHIGGREGIPILEEIEEHYEKYIKRREV